MEGSFFDFSNTNKPEDYDFVIHGETRIVLFEKTEEISYGFHFKMLKYSKIAIKRAIKLCEDIIIKKTLT